jgi:hypothetical protein
MMFTKGLGSLRHQLKSLGLSVPTTLTCKSGQYESCTHPRAFERFYSAFADVVLRESNRTHRALGLGWELIVLNTRLMAVENMYFICNGRGINWIQ